MSESDARQTHLFPLRYAKRHHRQRSCAQASVTVGSVVLPPEKGVPIPEEYQRYATECIAWAHKAKTDAERKAFLDMARAWTLAAARANGRIVPTPLDDAWFRACALE